MFDPIKTLLILIPALPLAATLLTALLGKRVLRGQSHLPAVVAVAVSCLASLALLFLVHAEAGRVEGQGNGGAGRAGYERVVTLWNWSTVEGAYRLSGNRTSLHGCWVPRASCPCTGETPVAPDCASISTSRLGEDPNETPIAEPRDFRIDVALRADPLTAVMLATVTFVSLLVTVYSIGYMRSDPGYWRFFTYISLFVFSMTMLVSVNNFILLYVFWEAVGLCSYLLIGFWFRKPEAAAAGKKAFLVNRVGDFGLALGIFLIWITFGSLDFHDVLGGSGGRTVGDTGHAPGAAITAICLLLFLGACGKSAQFPLHVWLPDAMEGPTPVSALIHAATMVTAGVYLVARCMPLFIASVDAQHVVAAVGGLTALLAALIAVTQTDLKRILAYSTISQLGYMFLSLGTATAAGVTAGMFHLFTHAFFKALLFLGAGSMMHATAGGIDVRRLGGLRRRLPTTHWTFLFGCLALAGIVPWAGFWSKDLILLAVGRQGVPFFGALYVVATLTAFLTAFYAFRAYFLTFCGKSRLPAEAEEKLHESPRVMTVPLVILAVCALVVGALFEPTHLFGDFLERTPSLASMSIASDGAPEVALSQTTVALTGTLAALAGLGLAALLYLGPREPLVRRWSEVMDRLGLYKLSHEKFFLDEIHYGLVVAPLKGLARLCYLVDRVLIDGLVNLCGRLPLWDGAMLRPLQNGMTQFYALGMVMGVLVLIAVLLL